MRRRIKIDVTVIKRKGSKYTVVLLSRSVHVTRCLSRANTRVYSTADLVSKINFETIFVSLWSIIRNRWKRVLLAPGGVWWAASHRTRSLLAAHRPSTYTHVPNRIPLKLIKHELINRKRVARQSRRWLNREHGIRWAQSSTQKPATIDEYRLYVVRHMPSFVSN